ncbi:hypothetical protein MJO29_014709 [Puccinia striiformis f. sp. tritici]|nr:hypothetical protein MJO29_014709 [Puccinia striiformis f. sp. tritici]
MSPPPNKSPSFHGQNVEHHQLELRRNSSQLHLKHRQSQSRLKPRRNSSPSYLKHHQSQLIPSGTKQWIQSHLNHPSSSSKQLDLKGQILQEHPRLGPEARLCDCHKVVVFG